MAYYPIGLTRFDFKPTDKVKQILMFDDAGYDLEEILPPICPFGGFAPNSLQKKDFLLIAECSEVSGPTPIYTVPHDQTLVKDLNSLCVRLMSVDYLDCGPDRPFDIHIYSQMVIPDALPNIHVAIMHFSLYDAQARGFVRPMSISFVSSEKQKLLMTSKKILGSLRTAALLLQSSNFSLGDIEFQNLLEDLEYTKSNLSTCDNLVNDIDGEEKIAVYDNLISCCMDDVQKIIDIVSDEELLEDSSRLAECFYEKLSSTFVSRFYDPSVERKNGPHQPVLLKVPIQQNFDKKLRNLLALSPHGAFPALYHLNLMARYFGRGYEDIVIHEEPQETDKLGTPLFYGSCIKIIEWSDDRFNHYRWCFKMEETSIPVLECENDDYLSQCNVGFFQLALDFLKKQSVEKIDGLKDLTAEVLKLSGESSASNCSVCLKNGLEVIGFVNTSLNFVDNDFSKINCRKHTVSLNRIWDALAELCNVYENIEMVLGMCLRRLAHNAENIFYCIFSNTLLVILHSEKEEHVARVFSRFLAILVPRRLSDKVTVLHHVNKPRKLDDGSIVPVVTYPIPCDLEELLNVDLTEVAIMDFSTEDYTGPSYRGRLLKQLFDGCDELFDEEPFFPLLICALSEIEMEVQLWRHVVESEGNDAFATTYLLGRELSKFDVQILEHMTSLCDSSDPWCT